MSDPRTGAGNWMRFGRAEAIAIGATVLWLAVAVVLMVRGPGTGPQVLAVVASVMPVVLVWVALAMLRVTRSLQAEAGRVQAALQELRLGAADLGPATMTAPGDDDSIPAIERRLEALMAAQSRVEAALARALEQQRGIGLAPAPQVPASGMAEAPQAWVGPDEVPSDDRPALAEAARPAPSPAEAQPVLALGVPDGTDPAMQSPVTVADFLRALNFPDTVEDRAGFDALRAGLADPRAARVIRAAQDVLTLLSEDGIYMDDLMPPPRIPEPELWRRFARGERGRAVAGLGGVEDPASLDRTAARMREDAVFRDVAHHFLRHFDRMIEALEPNVTDADLAQLAETRSARAFMLLGRVSGSFG